MTISTNTLLSLLDTNIKLDKSIKEKIVEKSTKGTIDIKSIVQDKSIQNIIDDLLTELLSSKKSPKIVNKTLLDNKTLFSKENFTQNLSTLIKVLKNIPNISKIDNLKDFLINIKDIDTKQLESNIKNSGIFFEAKLFSNKDISKDLKNILLDIDNKLEQIDIKNISNSLEKKILSKTLESSKIVKDIKNFLENKDNKTNTPIKNNIIETLLSYTKSINRVFKTNPSIEKELKNILENIKLLDTNLNDSKTYLKNIDTILLQNKPIVKKELLKTLDRIEKLLDQNIQILKTNISKKTNNIKEEDRKLSSHDDIKVAKESIKQLITQIEYYQILSLSSFSQIFYLPFIWDSLDDGEIAFKKDDDITTCQIDLEFISYGKVKIFLKLQKEKNININISIENEKFKNLIKSNLPLLRSFLKDEQILIDGINIFSLQNIENNLYNSEKIELNMVDIKI